MLSNVVNPGPSFILVVMQANHSCSGILLSTRVQFYSENIYAAIEDMSNNIPVHATSDPALCERRCRGMKYVLKLGLRLDEANKKGCVY